jgi:GNAT superfamily N-acetyltransferase
MSAPLIRPARAGDEDAILSLLYELAIYERLEHQFRLTPETVARDFLREPPAVQCELAFLDLEPAGIMTWYPTYSSFAGTRGIYLEDFYIRSKLRQRGIGRALLASLARHAVENGANRIEWSVIKWNRPAIDFYENMRAERIDDWHIYRLAGKALADLAAT